MQFFYTVICGLVLLTIHSPCHLYAQDTNDGRLRVIAHIATSWVVGNSVVEPLITVDNDNRFVPCLATSYQIDSEHMDLELRQGVRFQDGTPFSSQSVLDNWQRYLTSAEKVPPYFTLDLRKAVTRMEALGPYRLRIHFKPQGFIGQILVYLRSFYIYSPTYFAQHDSYPSGNQANIWTPGPWGTGPFRLTETAGVGQNALLERNADYWQADRPGVDQIEILGPKAVDSRVAHEWMANGKADLYDGVNPSMLPWLSRAQSVKLKVKHPISHLTSLYNMRRPESPLRDLRVRQALNYLIDRKTLFKYVSHQTAHMVGFILPLSDNPALQPYPYAPDKATQLLLQAGYSEVEPLFVRIGYFASEEKLAKAIGTMLKEGGIQVSYDRYLTRGEYYNRVKNYTHGPDNPIEAEIWDLNIVNSGLYTNSIATHFEAFFSQGGNRWIEADPEADRLFLEAMRQPTPEAVTAKLIEMERYLYEQHYAMPIYMRATILAVHPRIAHNQFSGSGYLLNLKEITVVSD